MNIDTKSSALPNLTADILSNPLMPVDNMLARLWNSLGIKTLLARAGFTKCSGVSAPEVVHLMMVWVRLKIPSIRVLSRESLKTVGQTQNM